jgi:hypothetical protein
MLHWQVESATCNSIQILSACTVMSVEITWRLTGSFPLEHVDFLNSQSQSPPYPPTTKTNYLSSLLRILYPIGLIADGHFLFPLENGNAWLPPAPKENCLTI